MVIEPMGDEQITEAVRARYAGAARLRLREAADHAGPQDASGKTSEGACGCGDGCCGEAAKTQAIDPITTNLYDASDTPFDAALAASLGCGNPTALAQLSPGEDVLDLGSGGGLDVLLSARRIAPGGTAYGLDLTPEMLQLAERHRAEAGIENARFMLGAIERVPLPDAAVDVVISNCVINLSADKDAVLREAFRVLRPGGRFAVSDIVLLRDIPGELRAVVALWTGCISGALRDTDYVAKLTAAGFEDAGIEVTRRYDRAELEAMADQLDPTHLPAGMTLADAVQALDGAFASAFIRATKPA
ncbi:arsenite methyltransferase [Piscicoccus intestinalis]|uniref:arsenite methyltransferase n=1 Tax=Piscicoccus intestinalis TaxID=746033 RepID=UPI000AAD2B2E|nr:arsenite methyltransferase [Piscicoccus intestinalis]